jgi:hypothetical protein
MSQTVTELRSAIRDMLHVTFVEPVRDGRPRPRSWPLGLGTVGTVCAVVFALLGLAIVGSGWLRQADRLVLSPSSGNSLPSASIPLLLAAVVLAFALALTAALHAPWWLRLCLLALTGEGVLFFLAPQLTNTWTLVPAGIGVGGLVVFTIVRWFGRYAWWEFAVVLGLLLAAMFGPWLVPQGFSFGLDTRLTAIEGAMSTLQPLILPAVVVAASAPAQIVVTAAQATADRPVGPRLFRVGLVVTPIAFAVVSGAAVAGGQVTTTALAAAVALLLPTVGVVAVLVRRAGVAAPPRPEVYPPAWSGWLYPIGAALTVVVVVLFLLTAVQSVATVVQARSLADALGQVWYLVNENQPGIWWRGILGAIALVFAWRFSGRQRLVEAVLLGSFAVVALIDVVGLAPGLDPIHQRSPEVTGFLVGCAAVIAAAVLLARRRLDRTRAIGLLTVLLLAILYPQREVLADPVSAVLQIAPAALLIFGISWRILTEAQVTSTGSARYPQATRILLYLANIVLAAAGIAWVSLSRGTGTDADPSRWAVAGDSYLGEPLYYAGLISGIWLMLRPPASALQPITEPAAELLSENVPVTRTGDIASPPPAD